MNRCALLLASSVLAASAAMAEVRQFPEAALRGELQVTQPPQVLLDGRTDRLSPGARIRGVRNELVMSASIAGQRYLVNYTRESQGLIHEVWLLTEEEAAQKRRSASSGRNFLFGSEAAASAPR